LAARAPHVLGRKAALLVWGMKDRGVPARHFLPQWRELFPCNVFMPLAGASHYFQEDAPTLVVEGIRRAFLNETLLTRARL
jgi:haloalkane dehalogenase